MSGFSEADMQLWRRAMLGEPGHQAGAAEKAKAYAMFARLREQHYGPVPGRERGTGLAGESMYIRAVFGGPR